jgi:predicted LPLAT superfamily acyltransferase
MTIVILFYLLVNIRATGSIYNYFRKRQHFGRIKSIFSTYLNHFLFGKTFIDKFSIFAGRANEYTVEFEGQTYFDEIVSNEEKGAIILNSHVGSAEIAGYLLKQGKKKMNALVFGGEASVIQKYRSEILEKQNIHLIPVIDGFSHIFEVNNASKKAELISMAADRIYEGSKNNYCDFLGAPAPFPVNPFQLALKLQMPILAFFVMQCGHKKYRIYVRRIDSGSCDDERSTKIKTEVLLNKYVSTIEQILKIYPLQWYNFYNFWPKTA